MAPTLPLECTFHKYLEKKFLVQSRCFLNIFRVKEERSCSSAGTEWVQEEVSQIPPIDLQESPLPSPQVLLKCYKRLLFSSSLQSIGCDDYLGSDKVVDKCGVCGGDNTGCQVVSGVFKHAFTSLGYHRVVEIPQGATKINITEMYKSNNYLGKFGLFPEEAICHCQIMYSFQGRDRAVSRGP